MPPLQTALVVTAELTSMTALVPLQKSWSETIVGASDGDLCRTQWSTGVGPVDGTRCNIVEMLNPLIVL